MNNFLINNLSWENKTNNPRCMQIFKILRISVFLLLLCAFTVNADEMKRADIQQQTITITGKVTDATGDPLPGVSITIKGLTQGTATDANGAYTLAVPNESATLVFTYIGFARQEKEVGSQRTINVTLLEDTRQIEEIIVVGYGALKKENLTGAVVQLKGDVLENRPVQYVTQALQGQVANLNIYTNTDSDNGAMGGDPGAQPSINIRGYTGLGSFGGPLIIVDGVQGGDLRTINMNDVESISVLKDAASAAIYGSSAPFGVIIITTKKGSRDRRPTITYNNNFGFAQPINLPKMANSYDWALMWNEACDNASVAHPFTDENVQLIKDAIDGKIPPMVMIPDEREGYDAWRSPYNYANTNWVDFYFKKSTFQQQHNIGVSGGSDKSSYYLGLGYNDQNGTYNFAEEYNRQYRVRVNLTSDVTKWLTVSFRGNFSRSALDKPSAMEEYFSIDEVTRKWPTNPTKNTLGNWHTSTTVVQLVDGGRDHTDTDWTTLTGEFVLKPLPGWDITGNYTLNGTYQNQIVQQRTTYNTMPSGALVVASNATNSVRREAEKNQHHAVNLFTSFEKQLSDHYFKVVVGYTQELYDNLSTTMSNRNLYSNDLPSLTLTYNPERTASDAATQLAIQGGFGRINYNYKEKYLVEFNGRYDGTSRFMKDVRMKFYPGASAAWVPSKEAFWAPLEETVNYLKLRVSYGQLGDQSAVSGRYPFYPSLGTTAPTGSNSNWFFSDGRQSFVSNPSLINQRLTWVTTTTIDFGADLAFVNQKLNLSFDWYRRYANDYVGPAEVLPSLLGASQPQVNNSSMETKGYELTIGWSDRALDNQLHYSANLVFADSKSVITKFPNPTGLNTTWYEGQVIGSIWGYKSKGLFKTQAEIDAAPSQNAIHANWTPGDVRYEDLNGDGVINYGNNTLDNPGDRTVIGNTSPRYQYGLTLAADYKGFDFYIFMQGVGKRDYWSTSNLFWGIHEGGIYNSSWQETNFDRWKPDNPNGYFPKYYLNAEMIKNIQPSDRYLENAAYMRIKSLQLGYSIPTRIIDKINCQRARIFMSAENLATFTKLLKTFDPELMSDAGRGGGKIYPLSRTWSFGLNVTF